MRFIAFAAAGAALLALAALGASARAGDPPTSPADEVATLRAEMETLRGEVASLRQALATLRARVAVLEGRAVPATAPTVPPVPGMGEGSPTPSASAPASAADVLVDSYLAYSESELREPAHAVTVERLLAVVGDESLARGVRQRAAEAIAAARTVVNDPALGIEGKGLARPRARFSQKVLTLLVEADEFTRTLAKSILEGLWVGWKSVVPDIRNCDPRDLDLCFRASQAWEKLLRDK